MIAQAVRIGLIGCGGIARSAHLPALARLRGRACLAAVADVHAEAAKEVAHEWDVPAYTNHERLLERDDVDMVLIATPEFYHREQVVAAAAAGKHVLCEKPMAHTVEDALEMITAADRAGIKLMIGHSRRTTGRYQQFAGAIERGEIGEVRLVRENERRSRPRVGQTGTYFAPGHWTGDPERSGGAALTNGIHETDILRWFAGSAPVSVFAEHAVTRFANVGVPDFITFTIRFANGAIGSSEITNLAPPSYPAFHQLDVFGSQGALRARDTELTGLVQYTDDGATYPDRYHLLLHRNEAYVRQLAGFVDAVRTDLPVPLSPWESLTALELSLAAVRSANTGAVIKLDDMMSLGRAGQ